MTGVVTRVPEGRGEAARETLLLNIDEILMDRADAYRLHRREKERLELFRVVTRTPPRYRAS